MHQYIKKLINQINIQIKQDKSFIKQLFQQVNIQNQIKIFNLNIISFMSRNPLQKIFKTQGPALIKQEVNLRQTRADSLYNLKDFLPKELNIQQRHKNNSTFYAKTQINLNQNKFSNLSINNVQQKMIEQKMNKLKQQNYMLQQLLNQEQQKSKTQAEEIQKLKKIVDKIKQQAQIKGNNLKMWSYKYHIQYSPKQKHKYELAVQTQDSYNQQGGLRAKDFQDIYKKLNSNPSSIFNQGNKKSRKQSTNFKLIPDFTTQRNPSFISHKNSTVIYTKNLSQNNSLFKIPRLEYNNQYENKQNQNQNVNIIFSKNPMQINLEKKFQAQKPIKQQCIEIYPVQQGYLDAIIGQILCGEDQ